MSLRRTILDAIKTGVAAAAALVSVVVLLAGSAQVCLCDPDPDNCGESCHTCVENVHALQMEGVVHLDFGDEPVLIATEADCHHMCVAFGDLFSSSTHISVPFVASCPVEATDRPTPVPFPRTMRPASTAPPDTGGVYLLHATRIYPRA